MGPSETTEPRPPVTEASLRWLRRPGADAPALLAVRPGAEGLADAPLAQLDPEADLLVLVRQTGMRPYAMRVGAESRQLRAELHLALLLPGGGPRQLRGGSSSDALLLAVFPRGWLAERLRRPLHAPRVWSSDPGFADLIRLFAALEGTEAPVEALLDHWLGLLANRLMQLCARPASRQVHLPGYRLTAVRSFVEANLAGEIGLPQMAQAAGLSMYHFARAFRRETGLTPRAWLEQRRVAAAQALLREPGMALTEAAAATGFRSAAALRKAHQRVTGAPLAAREGRA